ncbi:hypothetical protein DP187_21770 [Enterobacter cloacae]|nr:hypothetical protein DP187_21770 [Enterobacter cloacae]
MSYLKPFLGNTLIEENALPRIEAVLNNKAVFRYAADNQFCRQVEKLTEKILHTKHALLLTNGTAALKAALLGLKPVPGQYVLIPSISFIATANAVLSSGLIPVLVDVDESGGLSPVALETGLRQLPTPPLAVIAVHLEGASAQIERISAICQRYNIALIEDCAQSMAVTHQGSPVGSFGDYGCFSFQSNKLISSGEGGLLIASDEQLFRRASMVTDHGATRTPDGMPDWSDSIGFGENCKFNELQATLLINQLEHIDKMCDLLRDRYAALCEYLPAEAVDTRPEGSIPVSIWLKRGRLGINLLRSPLLYDWKSWDLFSHPVLRKRLSPYANAFPWSLHTDTLPEPSLTQHWQLLEQRLCLPVSLDDSIHQRVLELLKTEGSR